MLISNSLEYNMAAKKITPKLSYFPQFNIAEKFGREMYLHYYNVRLWPRIINLYFTPNVRGTPTQDQTPVMPSFSFL